jgi:hypothetical protein
MPCLKLLCPVNFSEQSLTNGDLTVAFLFLESSAFWIHLPFHIAQDAPDGSTRKEIFELSIS